MSVTLGMKVFDELTGFTGIVTASVAYLRGSGRCCVEALVEGKPQEYWFTTERLRPVEQE